MKRLLIWTLVAAGALGVRVTSAQADDAAAAIRVAPEDGVWWFVKPNGERFFSLGVNCVEPGPNRDHYDPARPAFAAFRHYDSTEQWADDVLVRLQAWNFNTLGGWCDRAVTRGPLPYTKVLHLGASCGAPWVDVFSQEFPTQIERFTKDRIVPNRDDHLLMGYFTDNELGWYPDTLFLYHLHQPPASATRQRLIQLLKDRYQGDFAALSKDFTVTSAGDFAALDAGGDLHPKAEGGAQRVIQEFTGLVAERYYQVVHDAVRKFDATHLILGDRYNGYCPDAVAKAAGAYVDVVSTNYDWPPSGDGFLPLAYLKRLHELSGRPVLVTEYYVAAKENRSGNPNSGNIFTIVATQEDRAAAFEKRLRILSAEPYIVGTHWFGYADEPPGGRLTDGEDYNFGLVDIENRPYEPLITAMTGLHAHVSELHAGSRTNTDADTKAATSEPQSVPAAKDLPMDGIATWEKQRCIPTLPGVTMTADMLTCWDTKQVYVAIVGVRYVDEHLYRTKDATQASIPLLQFSVGAANDGKPISFRFGNRNDVTMDGKEIDCRVWQDGIRFTAIAAIPAATFGKQELKSGDRMEIRAVLRDPRDEGQTRWSTTLRLD